MAVAALVVAWAIDLAFDARRRDVFTWMDPYQYFDFARDWLAGSAALRTFEVPSIFPLLLTPALAIEPSIPAAILANAAFAALLAWALAGLCRETGVSAPPVVVVAVVLSSPLLIGLSRSVYIEFGLAAVAAVAFLFWLRFLRAPGLATALPFAGAFGFGFLMKTTFPLFFVAPAAAAIAGCVFARRRGDALALVYATVAPLALVVSIHAAVFPGASGYYASLGNTFIPVMKLLGPTERFAGESVRYYFVEIARIGVFLLAPLLVLAAAAAARRLPRVRWSDLAGPQAALWLWLLGPLVLLIAQPVKEPRHVAPCVAPAALLVALFIGRVDRRGARNALLAGAATLAAIQFLLVTRGVIETPYFLDRPLHWEEIRAAMLESTDSPFYRQTPDAARALHWSYNQNVALDGFSANEALAVTWQLFPGVTIDLETLADPARLSSEIPFAQYEDLFLLSAFNTYNRRSGWRHYTEALAREEAIRNAGFVLVNARSPEPNAAHFPDHDRAATIARDGGGWIHVLRARLPVTPYRVIYAQHFLARNPALPDAERRVVSADLLMAAVLGGYRARAENLLRRNPELRDAFGAMRNIYWIGGYDALIDRTRRFTVAE